MYLADGCVRVWREPYESLHSTCQQGSVQSGVASVMIWDVYIWCDMVSLIRLQMTLTGIYTFCAITYIHSCLCIPTDLDKFGQIQDPLGSNSRHVQNNALHMSRVTTDWILEWFSDFRYFYFCHPNPQIWSGIPWNVLFRTDLHHFVLLWIYRLPCMIHSVNCLQGTFRH